MENQASDRKSAITFTCESEQYGLIVFMARDNDIIDQNTILVENVYRKFLTSTETLKYDKAIAVESKHVHVNCSITCFHTNTTSYDVISSILAKIITYADITSFDGMVEECNENLSFPSFVTNPSMPCENIKHNDKVLNSYYNRPRGYDQNLNARKKFIDISIRGQHINNKIAIVGKNSMVTLSCVDPRNHEWYFKEMHHDLDEKFDKGIIVKEPMFVDDYVLKPPPVKDMNWEYVGKENERKRKRRLEREQLKQSMKTIKVFKFKTKNQRLNNKKRFEK